jgi:hypothetical protein
VSDRPVAETQLNETDIHVSGAIRTRNPSKQATADRRLRTRGNRDRVDTHVATSDYDIRNYGTTSFSGWLLIIHRNLPPAFPILKMQVGFPKIWGLLMKVRNFHAQREFALSNELINNFRGASGN